MNKKDIVITTDRLILKNSSIDDAKGFFDILSNSKMAHFVKLFTDVSEAKKMLENKLIKYSSNNGIMFSVFENNNRKMIGNINLKMLNNNTASLSYIINPDYWNQGYATEASKRVIEYAFDKLQVAKIVSDCNENNLASIKILKDKLGMKLIEIKQDYMFDDYRKKQVAFMFFELTKNNYSNNSLK